MWKKLFFFKWKNWKYSAIPNFKAGGLTAKIAFGILFQNRTVECSCPNSSFGNKCAASFKPLASFNWMLLFFHFYPEILLWAVNQMLYSATGVAVFLQPVTWPYKCALKSLSGESLIFFVFKCQLVLIKQVRRFLPFCFFWTANWENVYKHITYSITESVSPARQAESRTQLLYWVIQRQMTVTKNNFQLLQNQTTSEKPQETSGGQMSNHFTAVPLPFTQLFQGQTWECRQHRSLGPSHWMWNTDTRGSSVFSAALRLPYYPTPTVPAGIRQTQALEQA